MKKDIETINKGQEEMKNRVSELKNTVEGIKIRLDEAEDRISEQEDKVEKKTQKQSKPKDIQRANINNSPRSASSGDQGDHTTESHRYSTIEVHTINPGSQNRLF